MAVANNSKILQRDFVPIPVINLSDNEHEFSAFVPLVLLDGEYEARSDMSVGKSIPLAPVASEAEALQVAHAACLSMDNAIGFAVKGVRNA